MASEVHCTDCLRFIEEDGLKEALGDRKAVLVSDPPFNIGYHYTGYKDRMKEDDYYRWIAAIISKAGIPAVIVHYPEALYRIAMELGEAPERVASWVYNSNTARQHRDIAFFGIKPDFSKVRQPYKNPNDKRIKERIARGIGGETLRLVECRPGEEREQEEHRPSVRHAIQGHGERDRRASGGIRGVRPIQRFGNDRHRLCEARAGLHWVRDSAGVCRAVGTENRGGERL